MRLRLLIYVLAGVALVAAAVAWIFYMQRGAHMEIQGAILKVRTLSTDENSSVALIDFRCANAADYPWVIRSVGVSLTDAQGNLLDGTTVADVDAARLFEYFPLLGPKFNDSLVARARIQPRQTVDRMIAARFEIPEKQLQARRSLRIRVEDVDGAVSEIVAEGRDSTRSAAGSPGGSRR
jgi:hypothetical protein